MGGGGAPRKGSVLGFGGRLGRRASVLPRRSDITGRGGAGYYSRGESGKEEEALTGEILDKFSQLITTALGLVAALAWNDAIQTLFQQFLGSAGGALAAKIFYAVLVTIIVTTSVPKHKHTHFAV